MVESIFKYKGRRVHFIGIGGSSMSGLAALLNSEGYIVSGSDKTRSHKTEHLEEAGIRVAIGHDAANVHGADVIVYSAAIAPENPERAEAARLGIPQIERCDLIGQLMSGSRFAVGVSGTHGKTTTTSMLAQCFMSAGLDPTIHIGGELDFIGGSTRRGGGEDFIVEACEFHSSFLHFPPTIAVVLNIDADHLDCYKDIDEIEETFGQFLHLLPDNGVAIGKGTDERVVRQLSRLNCRTITFGLTADCDVHPAALTEDDNGYYTFDLCAQGNTLAHVKMGVPGRFNVENGLAALTAAWVLGADMAKAAESLARFTGAHRRFELTGLLNGAEMFHDYGHNPAEMRNAVAIARKRCKGTLYAVMQPHTFDRVKHLFNDYLTCTEAADVTVVMDIFSAREKRENYPDLDSGKLVAGMQAHGLNAVWTPSFDDTEAYLRAHLKPGDLAITMGCGDVNLLNEQIEQHEKSGR